MCNCRLQPCVIGGCMGWWQVTRFHVWPLTLSLTPSLTPTPALSLSLTLTLTQALTLSLALPKARGGEGGGDGVRLSAPEAARLTALEVAQRRGGTPLLTHPTLTEQASW